MDPEPIRLSDDNLKALKAAIPFRPNPSERPPSEPISPVGEFEAARVDNEGQPIDPIDLEPYRKKFKRKSGGDVVQGSGFGYDTDIILNPSDQSRKPIDGDVSPL